MNSNPVFLNPGRSYVSRYSEGQPEERAVLVTYIEQVSIPCLDLMQVRIGADC